jgi:hypothetical protein
MIFHVLLASVSYGVLGYASVWDVAKREIPDGAWLLGIPLCLVLDLYGVLIGEVDLYPLAASLTASAVIGSALCRLGFYGGADAKALVLAAAAMPLYIGSGPAALPFLLVFASSTVFATVYPLGLLVLNLVDAARGRSLLRGIEEKSMLRRLVLYFVARRVGLDRLRGLSYFPAETVIFEEGRPVRRPVLLVQAEADVTALVKELEKHRDLLENGVLASPTVPMVVFILSGMLFSSLVAAAL